MCPEACARLSLPPSLSLQDEAHQYAAGISQLRSSLWSSCCLFNCILASMLGTTLLRARSTFLHVHIVPGPFED